MSLVCFRNGSLAREAIRNDLEVTWDAFEESAATEHLTEEVMLPFAEPEITPRTDHVGLVYSSEGELNPPERIRLLLEGQFLNMKLQSQWMNLQTEEIFVTGGASSNGGICQIIADVFGVAVKRLSTTSSASIGAAMRAAQAGCGEGKQQLESSFCITDSQGCFEPNSSLEKCYADKLAAFKQLLELNCAEPSLTE